jgi:hypothetical protein
MKGKLDAQDPHAVAPLLGRLKGKDGEQYHMLLLASQMALGLKVRHWLEQLSVRGGFTVRLSAMTMAKWCRSQTMRRSSMTSYKKYKTKGQT